MAQHDVELILARQLAGGLAVPVLLLDARGDTLYFNEPAEVLLGRRFDEIDVLPFEERTTIISPHLDGGEPLAVGELPGTVAIRERRPYHLAFHMHGLDGVIRRVESTAVPLQNAHGEVLGALILIWPQGDGRSTRLPPSA